MRNKKNYGMCLTVFTLLLVACTDKKAWWNNGEYEYVPMVNDSQYNGQSMSAADVAFLADNPEVSARVYNKRVPPLNSVIVCREKQCASASLSASREYIFNALAYLVDNNLDKTALLCEANPQAHVCVNPYLTVPAKVGVTPAYVFFDGVKIVDASTSKGKTALNLALGYNLSYNGQTPTVCKPDKAVLYVKSNNDIVLNGNGFKCNMTSVGTTTIRIMFNVDFIDLDYGYIGGYYSIGLSGPANGGGSGYGLIRLPEDAHPLKPALLAPERENAKVRPVVKPDVDIMAVNKPIVAEFSENKAGLKVEPAQVSLSEEKRPLEHGKLKLSPDVSDDQKDDVYRFETLGKRTDIKMQPIVITPDTVVRSDRIVLKPGDYPQKLHPFEEIYVDDLDEYIK